MLIRSSFFYGAAVQREVDSFIHLFTSSLVSPSISPLAVAVAGFSLKKNSTYFPYIFKPPAGLISGIELLMMIGGLMRINLLQLRICIPIMARL